MNVLVTGAAGFLGARLVEVLLEGGYRVLGLDSLDREEPDGWQEARLEQVASHKRFEFVQGDVTSPELLQSLFSRFSPKSVVHLASRRDLQLCEANPIDAFRLHQQGALNVMITCRRNNTEHLVLASTAHVYGGSRSYPFSENDGAGKPLSILGASFRSMELCAHAFSLRTPVNISVVRLFSVYGPRQSPVRMLPAFMSAAEKRAPLPIFGDGTVGRDMIYVDDAVVGLLRVLDRPTPWRIINLGSGETTTVGQVAELVSAEADVMLRTDNKPSRPGEMPNTWADISALEQVGFKPMVKLPDGIRRTWKWWQQRPEAFRV